MGVIHDHAEKLSGADEFKPARYIAESLKATLDGAARNVEADSHSDGGAYIVKVGFPHQRRVHLQFAQRRLVRRVRAIPAEVVV